MTADELSDQLAVALEGLQFHSESAHGAQVWRPGRHADDLRMTSDEFAEFIGLSPDQKYEFNLAGGFSGFMGWRCDDDPSLDEARLNDARRTSELVALMEANLEQLRVFRVGEATITCYVYGRHESGEVLGFTTTLIET